MSTPSPVDPALLARRAEVLEAALVGDPGPAREALTHADARVRAGALTALRRAGALDEGALATGLADPAPLVRRRAAQESVAVPQVPAPLLGLLDDPDATVVEVAAWALGERPEPDPGVVARLSEVATGHDDAVVREAAVAALGSLGDPAGLPAVLAATADKATVRRRAVIALAAYDGPEVDAALERALEDRDWQVRQAAEDLRA